MGFGDERDLKPEFTDAARAVALDMYPKDMDVVPGGNYAEHAARREAAADTGALLLRHLADDDLVNIEDILRKYRGEQ